MVPLFGSGWIWGEWTLVLNCRLRRIFLEFGHEVGLMFLLYYLCVARLC